MFKKIVLFFMVLLVSNQVFASTQEQKNKIFDAIMQSDAKTVKESIKNIKNKDELGQYLYVAAAVSYAKTFNPDFHPFLYHYEYSEGEKQKDSMAYAYGLNFEVMKLKEFEGRWVYDKEKDIKYDEKQNAEIINALLDAGARTDMYTSNRDIDSIDLEVTEKDKDGFSSGVGYFIFGHFYERRPYTLVTLLKDSQWELLGKRINDMDPCMVALTYMTGGETEDSSEYVDMWRKNGCSVENMRWLGFTNLSLRIAYQINNTDSGKNYDIKEMIGYIGLTKDELKDRRGKPTFYEHNKETPNREIMIYRIAADGYDDSQKDIADLVFYIDYGIVTRVAEVSVADVNPYALKRDSPEVYKKLMKTKCYKLPEHLPNIFRH